MNTTRVIITVVDALLQHKRHVFTKADRLQLSEANGQADGLSRLCILEIDPPHVWMRNQDAVPGVVVNGDSVAPTELHDGDELWVGDKLVTVCVDRAQVASRCRLSSRSPAGSVSLN